MKVREASLLLVPRGRGADTGGTRLNGKLVPGAGRAHTPVRRGQGGWALPICMMLSHDLCLKFPLASPRCSVDDSKFAPTRRCRSAKGFSPALPAGAPYSAGRPRFRISGTTGVLFRSVSDSPRHPVRASRPVRGLPEIGSARRVTHSGRRGPAWSPIELAEDSRFHLDGQKKPLSRFPGCLAARLSR